SLLAFMLLPVAYYVLFWVRRGWLRLAFIGGLGYLVAQLIKAIRYQGSLSAGLSWDNIVADLPKIIQRNFKVGVGDLSDGIVFLNIIKDQDSFSFVGGFSVLRKIISKVFPFLESPETVEYLLWDYYFDFGNNGSLHPSAYGVAYADGAWLGVVYFIFVGILRIQLQKTLIGTRDLKMI